MTENIGDFQFVDIENEGRGLVVPQGLEGGVVGYPHSVLDLEGMGLENFSSELTSIQELNHKIETSLQNTLQLEKLLNILGELTTTHSLQIFEIITGKSKILRAFHSDRRWFFRGGDEVAPQDSWYDLQKIMLDMSHYYKNMSEYLRESTLHDFRENSKLKVLELRQLKSQLGTLKREIESLHLKALSQRTQFEEKREKAEKAKRAYLKAKKESTLSLASILKLEAEAKLKQNVVENDISKLSDVMLSLKECKEECSQSTEALAEQVHLNQKEMYSLNKAVIQSYLAVLEDFALAALKTIKSTFRDQMLRPEEVHTPSDLPKRPEFTELSPTSLEQLRLRTSVRDVRSLKGFLENKIANCNALEKETRVWVTRFEEVMEFVREMRESSHRVPRSLNRHLGLFFTMVLDGKHSKIVDLWKCLSNELKDCAHFYHSLHSLYSAIIEEMQNELKTASATKTRLFEKMMIVMKSTEAQIGKHKQQRKAPEDTELVDLNIKVDLAVMEVNESISDALKLKQSLKRKCLFVKQRIIMEHGSIFEDILKLAGRVQTSISGMEEHKSSFSPRAEQQPLQWHPSLQSLDEFDSDEDPDFTQITPLQDMSLPQSPAAFRFKESVSHASSRVSLEPLSAHNEFFSQLLPSPQLKSNQNLMSSAIQSFDLNTEDEDHPPSISKTASFKPDLQLDLRPLPAVSRSAVSTTSAIQLDWANRVLALLFAAWKESPVFISKVSEALEKSANKDLPHYLGKIAISDFRIDGQAPELLGMYPLHMEKGLEFLYDIDVSFRGRLEVLVGTEFFLNWPVQKMAKVPIKSQLLVTSLNSRVRVGLTNNSGRGWLAMVGSPSWKVEFNPTLGSSNEFTLPANSLLKEWIMKKMRRFIFPCKLGFKVPGSFRFEQQASEESQ